MQAVYEKSKHAVRNSENNRHVHVLGQKVLSKTKKVILS